MSKKLYQVREGFSVRLPDLPEVYVSGGVIELDDETYALHMHKLEPMSEAAQAAFDAERAAAADEAVKRDQEADRLRLEAARRDDEIARDLAKQSKQGVTDAKAAVAAGAAAGAE